MLMNTLLARNRGGHGPDRTETNRGGSEPRSENLVSVLSDADAAHGGTVPGKVGILFLQRK